MPNSTFKRYNYQSVNCLYTLIIYTHTQVIILANLQSLQATRNIYLRFIFRRVWHYALIFVLTIHLILAYFIFFVFSQRSISLLTNWILELHFRFLVLLVLKQLQRKEFSFMFLLCSLQKDSQAVSLFFHVIFKEILPFFKIKR